MKRGWLHEACGVKVEHYPCPHPGQLVDLSVPPAGVLHTIEGSLASGLGVFRQHYAPTFSVGGHRILQHIPLGYMAAALVHDGSPPTNGYARVQIEVEGRSQTTPYMFPEPTLETLACLLAALRTVAGIPLSRPFPGLMPPPPWATPYFIRRRSGNWGRVPGWYGHVEIPENSHWDPGALRWWELLTRARKHVRYRNGIPYTTKIATPKPKHRPRAGAVPRATYYRLRYRHGIPYTELTPSKEAA